MVTKNTMNVDEELMIALIESSIDGWNDE